MKFKKGQLHVCKWTDFCHLRYLVVDEWGYDVVGRKFDTMGGAIAYIRKLVLAGIVFLVLSSGCGFLDGFDAGYSGKRAVMDSPSQLGGGRTTRENISGLVGMDGTLEERVFLTDREPHGKMFVVDVRITKPKKYEATSAHLQWLYRVDTQGFQLAWVEVNERPVKLEGIVALVGFYPAVASELVKLTIKKRGAR